MGIKREATDDRPEGRSSTSPHNKTYRREGDGRPFYQKVYKKDSDRDHSNQQVDRNDDRPRVSRADDRSDRSFNRQVTAPRSSSTPEQERPFSRRRRERDERPHRREDGFSAGRSDRSDSRSTEQDRFNHRSDGYRQENRLGRERSLGEDRRSGGVRREDSRAREGQFDRPKWQGRRREESRYQEPERRSFQWKDEPRPTNRPESDEADRFNRWDDRRLRDKDRFRPLGNESRPERRFNRQGDKPFVGDRRSTDQDRRSSGGERWTNRPSGSDRRDNTDRHRPDERKASFRSFSRTDLPERDVRKMEESRERQVGRSRMPEYNLERLKERVPSKKRTDGRRPIKTAADEGLIRLNRYIANAGICSRRDADSLIANGEIKVNGSVVTEMGFKVKPGDVVKYGNKSLNPEKMVYVLLNKPKDYITTTDDPNDRNTVMDLVASATPYRIYPVGRLDRNTTGLLLLTNDGELAEKLTHPSNNIKKVYQVEIDKPITEEHFDAIKKGIELEDGTIKPDDLGIVTPDAQVVGIEIHSGRNRIVRRIFEHFGYEVTKLDRTVYAGLNKKELPRGKWRYLDEKEVIRLKFLV